MSMILGLVTIGDPNISRVMADPPLIWRVIAPDDPEIYEHVLMEAQSPSFFRRLFGRKSQAVRPPVELQLSDSEGMNTDLDKAWHGIHYLLTGRAWEGVPPLNFLLAGGRQVGNIDVGYGPARVFTAEETRCIGAALDRLDDDLLRSHFNPEDMMEQDIYPGIWHRKPQEDDTLGYLMEYVQILRGFLSQAVDEGSGIIIYLF